MIYDGTDRPKLVKEHTQKNYCISVLAALAFLGQARTPSIYSLPSASAKGTYGIKNYRIARHKRNKLASKCRRINI